MSVKYTATIDEQLLARIDACAESKGMTRSAFIALACNDFMDAVDKSPKLLSQLSDFCNLTAQAMQGHISPRDYEIKVNALQGELKSFK